MAYIPTGGVCGGGYFESASANLNPGNASELSGSFSEVALSFCPGCAATVKTGTSAADAIALTGGAIGSGTFTDGYTNFSDAPAAQTGANAAAADRYYDHSPTKQDYSASDLGLTGDAYPGQDIQIRESLLLLFSFTRPELVEYAYLNRGVPYTFGGWLQRCVPKDTLRKNVQEERQILINLDNTNGYSAYYEYETFQSLRPKKGDFFGAAILEAEACNMKFSPDPPSVVLGLAGGGATYAGLLVSPDYKAATGTPMLVGKSQIPLVDLSTWTYETKLGNVALWIAPAWTLLSLTHQIEAINTSTLAQSPVQILNTYTCSTPS